MMKRALTILLALAFHISAFAQMEWADSLRLVPGVRVAALDGSDAGDVRIDIRALSSIRSYQQPLWVIDGAALSLSSPYSVQPFFQYGDAAYADLQMGAGSHWLNINDIESIEVLKNSSATAAYGSQGAGGVILVKTKRPEPEATRVFWSSRIGLQTSEIQSEAFSPALCHTHHVAVNSAGKRSWLRVSGFLTDNSSVIKGSGKELFGVRALFGATKSDIISFGGNLGFYKLSSITQSGAAWYGSPSYTLSVRGIAPSSQGWLDDYDNQRNTLRTTGSLYFNVKCSPYIHWDNSLSADFQALSQYLWYGDGTAFGKAQNGAASVISSSLLYIDAKSRLSYGRFFTKVHQVKAYLEGLYHTNLDYYNTMTGTNFVSHELRAKGLSIMESRAVIRHFNQSLNSIGGRAGLHYDYAGIIGTDFALGVEPYLIYDKGKAAKEFLYPSAELFADLKPLLMPELKQLSALRFEAGYGISGRRNLVPYDMLPLYTGGAYPAVDDDYKAFYKGFNRIRNSEFHSGLTVAFLKDAIRVYVGYYDRNIEDALALCKREKDDLNELSSATTKASLRGIEGSLHTVLLNKGQTQLTFRLNADYNFNKLTSVASGDEYGMPLNQYGLRANANREGYAPSSIYGWVLDENNTALNEGVLGNTIPRFTAAGELTLRSGSFTVSIAANAAAGFKILNMNRMLASSQEYVSSAFVENGDYFKLSTVSLGYDIPIKAEWIKALSLSLSANNLFMVSSYSGWNPEVNSFGYTTLANGLDYGSFPMARTILLGVSAKF